MRKSAVSSVLALTTSTCLAARTAWARPSDDPQGYDWRPFMMGWDGSWHMLFFAMLYLAFFIAILLAAGLLIAHWMSGSEMRDRRPQKGRFGRMSIDILNERFARGEIDEEEFKARRRILGE